MLIYAIGAAHEAGRRPWLELRRLIKIETAVTDAEMLSLVPDNGTPTEKLSALIEALQAAEGKSKKAVGLAANAASPNPLSRLKDRPVSFKAKGKRLMIEVSEQKERGFIGFVEANLERLYDEWKKNP